MEKIKGGLILKLILIILFFNLFLSLVHAQCAPNVVRTLWSEWENTSDCNSYNEINQRRISVEYDSNNCGSVENKTSYEYRIIKCGTIIDEEPAQNAQESDEEKSSFDLAGFFGFLNNKIFIYSLISIIAIVGLGILFLLLSKNLFKKKDINEMLRQGYKYLENGDIKNAKNSYDQIKKAYDKSKTGEDDAVYLRILEFYDAVIKSSLKSVSFKQP